MPIKRRDDGKGTEYQRIDRDRRLLAEKQDAQQHHRHRRHGIGLEEVGGHAGAVADIVADVVRNHSRVTGIVLRNAGLDLAHNVGADIGGLGEDPASEAGEDRDQRTAEAQADKRVDGVSLALPSNRGEHAVVAGQPDQRKPDDEHDR